MKKHILILALLLLPMLANAEEVEIDGINYNLISKGNVAKVIAKSTNYSGDISIPSKIVYEGKEYKVGLIGSGAFSSCSDLVSINLPNSLTNIENSAFYGCTSLISVDIPDGVLIIGDSSFSGCKGLTNVTIPNSVLSLGGRSFLNCSGLTSITIPNSVTSIGQATFSGCTSLTSITIGNNVKSIDSDAFNRCTNLSAVHISDLAAWCNIQFANYSNPLYYAKHLYLNDVEIKDLIIPDGMTHIKWGVFSDVTGFTSITIPNSVTSIDDSAFSGCSELQSVSIPNSVTNIGKYAFNDCSSLTSVNIPNSVTKIGESAFRGCNSLSEITLSNNTNAIESYTFFDCSSLTSVNIPEGVKKINDYAFYGCNNLASVTFPESLDSIDNYAFDNCPAFTDVYCPSIISWCNLTVQSLPSTIGHIFIDGKEVVDLMIPEGVEGIRSYLFRNIKSITSASIGNDVLSIGSQAFNNCSNLTSLTIGCRTRSIYNYAFSECEKLEDVYIYAEDVPNTGLDAFKGSYIECATLHVPPSAIDAYRSVCPWNLFQSIVPIEGEIPKPKPVNSQCATPTIEYSNGNVTCSCATDGVKYVYQIAPVTVQMESESGRFAFAPTYEIKVYATREGYKDSDAASIIVALQNVGDVNADGQVNIADVTSLVNAILGK